MKAKTTNTTVNCSYSNRLFIFLISLVLQCFCSWRNDFIQPIVLNDNLDTLYFFGLVLFLYFFSFDRLEMFYILKVQTIKCGGSQKGRQVRTIDTGFEGLQTEGTEKSIVGKTISQSRYPGKKNAQSNWF